MTTLNRMGEGLERIEAHDETLDEPEPVHQLVYASASVGELSDAELAEILTASRRNNSRLGITGMLLYHEGSFIQALEGPHDAVEELYAKIGRDPRHTAPRILFRGERPDRDFQAWSMGFHRPHASEVGFLDGFQQYLDASRADAEQETQSIARRALVAFRSGSWRHNIRG